MLFTKSQFAFILTLAVLSSTGVRQALADKPDAKKPAEAKPQKGEKPAVGSNVSVVVKSIDVAKSTITVATQGEKGKKEPVEKTIPLAKDAKLLFHDGVSKKDPPTDGDLAKLEAGTYVTLQLTADDKAVASIHVGPTKLGGMIKAINPTARSITIASKGPDGLVLKDFALTKEAKVLLNDGLAKGTADVEGKLADLEAGTSVALTISALDRTKVLNVHVQGKSYHGALKGVDTGNNSITLTVKGEDGVTDKTFTLAKGVRSNEAIGSLTPGTTVSVRLSVIDKDKVVDVQVPKGARKNDPSRLRRSER